MVEYSESAQLHMFYGMLNLDTLAQILPEIPEEHATKEQKIEYLKSKSVALTLHGWTRVFGSQHASIQEHEGKKVQTFGVYLTPKQRERTDQFENLGTYYDKL